MARPACPAPITATSTRAGRSEVPRGPSTPGAASGFREFRPFITCVSFMRILPSALVVELSAGEDLDGDDAEGGGVRLHQDLPIADQATGTGGVRGTSSRAISSRGFGSPARCGIHSSQRGRYQFQSPRSFIVAGRSTPRVKGASKETATGKPTP